MISYDPVYALLIFLSSSILLFLIFRPEKGWYWKVKTHLKYDEKIIIEDVLKQLYHSENAGNKMDINGMTALLKFKNDRIIEVVKQMTINELIQSDKGFLKLTDPGREYALRIVRVHRLWEKYLAEKTGFEKTEWHDQAEKMEHQLSFEETDKLAVALGNPIFDPHGDPIPTKKGVIAKVNGVVLPSLKVSSIGKITHIEDEPEVVYKQILAENIHIGSQIRVIENNNKRVVFYAEGEEFKLAPIVAANITVELIENEMAIEDNKFRLSSLSEKETAKIIGISKECRGENRRRLLDLGFVKGADISIDLLSPLRNPKAYLIKGTSIALRNSQASHILIQKNHHDAG
ncbi:MAG: DtxR family transcriptional regulator [Flavobacteriaceae bacterium]|nr:DtxR family transcriptional regulator [Flavobacteriaceae bacterium]